MERLLQEDRTGMIRTNIKKTGREQGHIIHPSSRGRRVDDVSSRRLLNVLCSYRRPVVENVPSRSTIAIW